MAGVNKMGVDHRNALLKKLPRVDDLISVYSDSAIRREYLKQRIHQVLEEVRAQILSGKLDSEEIVDARIREGIVSFLELADYGPLRRVINGTGVVLHTNLGRAIYDCEGLADFARHYSNLELNLETGERGRRNDHISLLLNVLFGAEAAIAVNNNAGAVLLVLSALSAGREVLVSRGEQVEIGGSFRIPEVAKLSGAVLTEVGTTNRTRVSDYARAIGENTAMILKVEPSNFKMLGQVASPRSAELSDLAKEHGIPFYLDLGSGVIDRHSVRGASADDLERKDLLNAIRYADLVSFSGDKLFGSAQAGLIVGKKEYIDLLERHPMYRALRLDRLSIYVLTDTIRKKMLGKKTLVEKMICENEEDLKKRTEVFVTSFIQIVNSVNTVNSLLKAGDLVIESVPTISGTGGGTFAVSEIPSYAIRIANREISPASFASMLRKNKIPVVVRQDANGILIDFRTILRDDEDLLKHILKDVIAKIYKR